MTARVMAEAVTRTLGGSAACPREAEPPQEHDLAPAKSRGTEEQENQSPLRQQPSKGHLPCQLSILIALSPQTNQTQ